MKFILLSILALVAFAVAAEGRQLDIAEDLKIRWHMDEPNVTYFSENNTFFLEFRTSHIDNKQDEGGLKVEFYDFNCQDDGSGFDEFIVPEGITGPDGVSRATMSNNPEDGTPQLMFTISPQILASYSEIYGMVTEAMVGTNTRYDETDEQSGSRRRLVGEDESESCKKSQSKMVTDDPSTDSQQPDSGTGSDNEGDQDAGTGTGTGSDNEGDQDAGTGTGTDSEGDQDAGTGTGSCLVNDPSPQSWKCGNNIYICPNIESICSVQDSNSANAKYYRLTPDQCNDMKAIEIGDDETNKCIELPQYNIAQKALSNRVCYGSSAHGIKRDGEGVDSCKNGFSGFSWETTTDEFECSVDWLQRAGKIGNFKNNAVQAAISGGCGLGVPTGYYPDLTVKNAYCHCPDKDQNGSYQRLTGGLVWDIGVGNTAWMKGFRSDDVPYGKDGLYGKVGGGQQWPDQISTVGESRPPFTNSESNGNSSNNDEGNNNGNSDNSNKNKNKRVLQDQTITEDTPSWAVTEEQRSRNLYIYKEDDVGKGVMRVCVRSSLGYTKEDDGFFQEVNFIESLITVFYDLSAGFCITAFNVDPKERQETTAAANAYDLEAWLCDMDEPLQARTNPARDLPAPVNPLYLAKYSTPSTASYFNQGSLITVCIAPDDTAYADGIRMNGINSFDWSRTDSNILQPVTQPAIQNGGPATNFLTSYIASDCEGGAEYCNFSSILYADFYINTGIASGAGTASLQFARRKKRRLGEEASNEESGRELQEGDETSTFDLSLGVVATDDGPNSLQRASGPSSFHTAALISSLMALLGATSLVL